jgi:hypothetical protein
MTRQQLSRLASATLTVAVLGASGAAFAYGSVAPMGVSSIEAQAPVTSLKATTTAAAEPRRQQPPAKPAARLRTWIGALRPHADDAREVALR